MIRWAVPGAPVIVSALQRRGVRFAFVLDEGTIISTGTCFVVKVVRSVL